MEKQCCLCSNKAISQYALADICQKHLVEIEQETELYYNLELEYDERTLWNKLYKHTFHYKGNDE